MDVNSCLARSLRARWARWERRWAPPDGIVLNEDATSLGVLLKHRLSARPYSATALQYFAACPYRFVLNSIHRLQPREELVALERMDPLTRGSFFHTLQFRLYSRLRALEILPITEANYTAVYTIADQVLSAVADEYREELAPAIPRIWELEIEDLRWDVRGWIRHVAFAPGASSWKPAWFELAFGLRSDPDRDPGSSAACINLASGVQLRGSIDLIEENSGRLRVTDHKTGRAPSIPIEFIGSGEALQPLLYAEAAEALLGKEVDSSRLFYCTERGQYRIVDVSVHEVSRKALAKVFTAIDESIQSGFLPAMPRKGACQYCDYQIVCGPYEEFRVQRKPREELAALEEIRETR
jgi:ATP-dependent helicase/DNAse subunit B